MAHLDGQTYNRIEFHTGTKTPSASLEAECNRRVVSRLPRGVAITFYLWKERPGGEKLHARYVLTDRGGVRFDVGLDLGDVGQTTDVSILGERLHLLRWKDFQAATAAYDLEHQFKVVGV